MKPGMDVEREVTRLAGAVGSRQGFVEDVMRRLEREGTTPLEVHVRPWGWRTRPQIWVAAAMVVILLGLLAVVIHFVQIEARAFADVVDHVRQAQTYEARETIESREGKRATLKLYRKQPSLERIEFDDGTVTVYDAAAGKYLRLDTKTKTAQIGKLVSPEGQQLVGTAPDLAQHLQKLRESPYDPPVREMIDGVSTDKLVFHRAYGTYIVWINWETALPARVELSGLSSGDVSKVTIDDIHLNVPLDEKLFSLTPPTDYRIEQGVPVRIEVKQLEGDFAKVGPSTAPAR